MIAGRVAWNGYGVYYLTKFGVNGFTESLRQEVTQRHVRVGVLEPGGVDTELGSHNSAEVSSRTGSNSPCTRKQPKSLKKASPRPNRSTPW
jgi:short-subunit dehydrogenase